MSQEYSKACCFVKRKRGKMISDGNTDFMKQLDRFMTDLKVWHAGHEDYQRRLEELYIHLLDAETRLKDLQRKFGLAEPTRIVLQ
jgi:hypothetical protein